MPYAEVSKKHSIPTLGVTVVSISQMIRGTSLHGMSLQYIVTTFEIVNADFTDDCLFCVLVNDTHIDLKYICMIKLS